MKLTTKQIMLILMSILLVLVLVLGTIVFIPAYDFVMALLANDKTPPTETTPIPSSSIPASSSTPPSSSAATQPTQTDPPHEHEYVESSILAPTCDNLGYTLYVCSCGKEDIRDFVDPIGHKYGSATVVPATCTTDGWTERTCSRCKHVSKENIVKAAHDFSLWANIELADGIPVQEQRTCFVCQMQEIRSLDTAQTWVLRISVLESEGAFDHYQLVVDLADNDADPTYELYVGLADKAVSYHYDETGLTISYTVEGVPKSHLIPSGTEMLTIYPDGSVTPVVTPPADPGTDPSDPTDPDIPTDTTDPDNSTDTTNPDEPAGGENN